MDKKDKNYNAEEAARKVLAKAHEMLKYSTLSKANTSHEIEAGEEPNNDDAECPEYLADADIEGSDSEGKKKKKASAEGEEDASEEMEYADEEDAELDQEDASEEMEYAEESEDDDQEDDDDDEEEEYQKSEVDKGIEILKSKANEISKAAEARKAKMSKSENDDHVDGITKVQEFLAKKYDRMVKAEEQSLEKDSKKKKLRKMAGEQAGKMKQMEAAKPAGGGASIKPTMPKQPESVMKPGSNGTGMKA